ncbi:SRPBCC family protein [Streptosporangium sp. OZ121]|uniref:SRPBCC family protein n=1 Tax=Streptosporangium sp. OZ121 TaxID=3444183 RepID=UPI003F79B043
MSYVIKTEVDINAGKEAVWDVLVDFPRYGEWSNFSRVEGTAQVGNRLSMKMPGFSFRPTVTVAEPGERLQWSGTLISERLFLGRHSFILLANPDGTTHLTNHEEFSGGLTTLMQRFMKQGGDNGYTAFNAGLKRQVEDRATRQNRT